MPLTNSSQYGLFTQRLLQRLNKHLAITYQPYFVFREGHTPLDPAWQKLPDDFHVEQLTLQDYTQVVGLSSWATAEEILRRLEAGHLCTLVCQGETVAGYTWADLQEINDAHCDYPLPAGHAYLYDAFVANDFRGSGLASGMRAACYAQLREQGVTGFVSISDQFNTPALKFKQRLGGEPIALYRLLQIGRWRVFHYRAALAQPSHHSEKSG
ncbi:MAG: GNAT family N-acetyltransferase [Pseudomonadota bacterium]